MRLQEPGGPILISEVIRITVRVLLLALLLSLPVVVLGQTKRVVAIECDGLPYAAIEEFVHEKDARTGKSQLPWFDYIFYQRGTRLENFYVRGMSLSAPSWSLINTGQHLQIKGNVEYDRFTLQTYDYLNFIPYYVQATVGKRVDMQGVEVLDALRIPLLADTYPRQEQHAPFSLFQRGPQFMTFQRALENKFKRNPKDVFDEWAMTGLAMQKSVPEQLVRDLIDAVANPDRRFLEIVLTDYDHTAHHNNDRDSHLRALKDIDEVLGRVWTAIQKSPLADDTTLIVVSDHGFNSDERVYSQGYNLVKLLGSPEGGGHHVITKRRLMLDYSIKGMNPFANMITTTTRDSYYLKKQSDDYPTALLDFDGNERASAHLRDSDVNLLQILLQQLQRTDLGPDMRQAVTDQFFKTIDVRRTGWQNEVNEINEELVALRRRIDSQRDLCKAQPKKFTKEEQLEGRDQDAKRVCAWYDIWLGQDQSYSLYAQTLSNLLALRKQDFKPGALKIENVIARRAMGDLNTVYELQNYIAGIAPQGLVLKSDGSLDMDKSFVRVNYFSLLHNITVRNNVQQGVTNRPVDLLAVRLPSGAIEPLIGETQVSPDVIWVSNATEQALILSREEADGQLSLRYVPIKGLTQDANGQFHFERVPWRAGLPLQIFEDPNVNLPVGMNKEVWLSEWHTDLEWLRALHKTHYSNGLIGLHEELGRHRIGRLSLDEPGLSADELLLRRLLRRQRDNTEADLLIMASDHWNFDVRGFNPGGNHGSFFRISTHSTFMLAGGQNTGVPRGYAVEEPYDNLSFVPTVLALTGNLRDDNSPVPVLWEKGFRFPGRPVKEVLTTPAHRKIAGTGAVATH